MNYAYGPDCEGWIESRKYELVRSLQNLVARYGGRKKQLKKAPM